MALRGRRINNFLKLWCLVALGGLDIWVSSSTSFQKSNIGWPQPPFYCVPSIFAVFKNLVWEIWFQKSGSAKSDFFSGWRLGKKGGFVFINSLFCRLEKSGSSNLDFFEVTDQRKKNPSLQNHFSRTGCRLMQGWI